MGTQKAAQCPMELDTGEGSLSFGWVTTRRNLQNIFIMLLTGNPNRNSHTLLTRSVKAPTGTSHHQSELPFITMKGYRFVEVILHVLRKYTVCIVKK